MSIAKSAFAGVCLAAVTSAIAATSPAMAETGDSQFRQFSPNQANPRQVVSKPVVQPIERRAVQTRPVTKLDAPRKRYIFTLNDRLVGGKTVVTADLDAVREARKRNAAAQERAIALFRQAGLNEIKPIKGSRFIAAAATGRQIAMLRKQGLIQAVEPDRLSTPTLEDSVPLLNPPPIWNIFNRGNGQVVAIIDTGVKSDHEMLAGRLESEACFSTTSNAMGTTALCTDGSTAPGSGEPCSLAKCWHGTHVAAIAVGRAGGTTMMNGVAPDAKYISVQAFSELQGQPVSLSSDLLAALYRIRDLRLSGVRIVSVNMSLGGGQHASSCGGSIETVFQQLRAINTAPVVSSGNDSYQGQVGWPACAPSAFVVGSSTKQDTMSPFSNLSPLVDVVAPGSDIVSATSSGTTSYATASGTSMAAPHVAGSFALLRQIYSCYSSETLENALRDNGVPITGPGSTGTFPRIDLGATYAALGQFRVRNCPISRDRLRTPIRQRAAPAQLEPR
ncbi:MAG: S8 family serine peptidase [Pseudomonadota bacterium]